MKTAINYIKFYPLNDYLHLETSLKNQSIKIKPNHVQKIQTQFIDNGTYQINILV